MAGSKGSKYYDFFLKYRVCLETRDDRDVINTEGFALLSEIQKSESIRNAAEALNISYRKAWGMLRSSEQSLGFSLVSKLRGGEKGGKTILSDDGIRLLSAYNELLNEIDISVKNVTKKFFHSINEKNQND
jgi:molybdate transport system regulatory protein